MSTQSSFNPVKALKVLIELEKARAWYKRVPKHDTKRHVKAADRLIKAINASKAITA